MSRFLAVEPPAQREWVRLDRYAKPLCDPDSPLVIRPAEEIVAQVKLLLKRTILTPSTDNDQFVRLAIRNLLSAQEAGGPPVDWQELLTCWKEVESPG